MFQGIVLLRKKNSTPVDEEKRGRKINKKKLEKKNA